MLCNDPPLHRRTARCLALPYRSHDDDAEPPTSDVPPADSHVDSGELLTTQAHQVVGSGDDRDGGQVRPRRREAPHNERDFRGAEGSQQRSTFLLPPP